MTRVLVDSSCLVAAALPFHEHHRVTLADLVRRRAARHIFLVAAHSLFEAYAVMTRLPPPHRIPAADAHAVLDRNWSDVDAVTLTGADAWRLLRYVAAERITGGRVYDAAIAATARKGKADELLTWNLRHFADVTAVRVLTPVE